MKRYERVHNVMLEAEDGDWVSAKEALELEQWFVSFGGLREDYMVAESARRKLVRVLEAKSHYKHRVRSSKGQFGFLMREAQRDSVRGRHLAAMDTLGDAQAFASDYVTLAETEEWPTDRGWPLLLAFVHECKGVVADMAREHRKAQATLAWLNSTKPCPGR